MTDAPKMYLYRLTRGNIEVTAEFVCQRHLDESQKPGGFMAPLADYEQRTYVQKITPYKGNEPCAMCEEEKEHGR